MLPKNIRSPLANVAEPLKKINPLSYPFAKSATSNGGRGQACPLPTSGSCCRDLGCVSHERIYQHSLWVQPQRKNASVNEAISRFWNITYKSSMATLPNPRKVKLSYEPPSTCLCRQAGVIGIRIVIGSGVPAP